MNRSLLIAALLLPLAGLAASVGIRESELSRAEQYVMPVTGFDPRDVLRGHYIRYRYDWQVSGDPLWCRDGACRICLAGDAPDGSRVEIRDLPSAPCPKEIDWQASGLTLYAVPATSGTADEAGQPARLDVSGIFYLSESDAPAMEQQMAETPMVMNVLLTSSGRLVNQSLIPSAPPSR
jgi:hypothetical protein|tara:strand:+ start:4300 stop:4836 length:537 start_codon:yes stop_codon:yes gene_type:complete